MRPLLALLLLTSLCYADETPSPVPPAVVPTPALNLPPPVLPPPSAPVNMGVCLLAGCLPEQHTTAPATNTKQWWQTGIEIAVGVVGIVDFALREAGH